LYLAIARVFSAILMSSPRVSNISVSERLSLIRPLSLPGVYVNVERVFGPGKECLEEVVGESMKMVLDG
jgi:hypothetical protein